MGQELLTSSGTTEFTTVLSWDPGTQSSVFCVVLNGLFCPCVLFSLAIVLHDTYV